MHHKTSLAFCMHHFGTYRIQFPYHRHEAVEDLSFPHCHQWLQCSHLIRKYRVDVAKLCESLTNCLTLTNVFFHIWIMSIHHLMKLFEILANIPPSSIYNLITDIVFDSSNGFSSFDTQFFDFLTKILKWNDVELSPLKIILFLFSPYQTVF